MDVASPPTACSIGRTTFDCEKFTLFTTTRKLIMLATYVTNGWHPNAAYRDPQYLSVLGQGHPSP